MSWKYKKPPYRTKFELAIEIHLAVFGSSFCQLQEGDLDQLLGRWRIKKYRRGGFAKISAPFLSQWYNQSQVSISI